LKLSEEERLKLRKLRFGNLGTNTTVEEAEKVRNINNIDQTRKIKEIWWNHH
jgi:hypothetical protein